MKFCLTICFFLACPLLFAGAITPLPTAEDDPNQDVFTHLFWRKLYAQGGWSLYCGYRFDGNGNTEGSGKVLIEHIYPTSWIYKQLDCKNRQQCRSAKGTRFQQMETDLHNMYPVWWEIKSTNHNTRYGEIAGEDWRFEDCDYERRGGVTEPRPIARGNVARTIFYMYSEYGLPIDQAMFENLKQWNRQDPPSTQEAQRNDRIEHIQGKRNAFIDDPALAETIDLEWLDQKKVSRISHTD